MSWIEHWGGYFEMPIKITLWVFLFITLFIHIRFCWLPVVSWSCIPPCPWPSWLDFWTCPSRSSAFSCSCSSTRWRTWCGPAASRRWTESSSQPPRSTSTSTRCVCACVKDSRPANLHTFCVGAPRFNVSACLCERSLKNMANIRWASRHMDFDRRGKFIFHFCLSAGHDPHCRHEGGPPLRRLLYSADPQVWGSKRGFFFFFFLSPYYKPFIDMSMWNLVS